MKFNQKKIKILSNASLSQRFGVSTSHTATTGDLCKRYQLREYGTEKNKQTNKKQKQTNKQINKTKQNKTKQNKTKT